MTNRLIPGVVLVSMFLVPCRAAEPLYAGRTLAFWLGELKSGDPLVREEAIVVLTDAGAAARSATPRLEELLKDPEHRIRVRAALALWRIDARTKPALAALTEALRDPDLGNRAEMLSNLSEMGSAAASNAAIVLPFLQDADAEVRAQAIQAMQRFGAAAVPSILPSLQDADSSRRRAAYAALSLLGPSAQQAVPKLTSILETGDTEARLGSLATLGRIGDAARSATPAILHLTHDKNPALRAAGLSALQQIAADPKLARPAVRDGLEDDDPLVRLRAVILLWHIAPKHPDIVPHVLELLKQPVGRTELLMLLREMGPAAGRTVPALIKLLPHTDSTSRRLAIEALQHMGPAARSAVPALLEQLNAADFPVRQAAVNALRAIGGDSDRIVPAVVEAARRDQTTCSMCLPLLGDQGAKARAAVPWLVAELRRRPPSYLTTQMAETLHKIDPERARKEAVPILQTMLQPGNSWRIYAAMSLRQIQPDNQEALQALSESLTDSNASTRQQACRFLGTLGKSARDAAPALSKLLNAAALTDRAAAAIALWKISGETETTVPVLLQALKPSPGYYDHWRFQAAQALGEMGPAVKTAALPALRQFRDDPSPAVRSGVRRAIEQIDPTGTEKKSP
jgi:HEAT repeat protein